MRSLLLLFTLFAGGAEAQVWCPPQAQWTYDANNFTSWGYMRFSYTGDTVITGQPCHKIVQEWNRYDFISSSYQEDTVGLFFTQELAGVATIWDGNAFDTLFNYNAVIGDHWQLANDGSFPGTATIQVTDTGSTLIEDVPIHWRAVSLDIFPGTDTIFERIGGKSLYWIPWQNGIPDLGGGLRCYSDVEMAYSTDVSPSCDFTTSIEEADRFSSALLWPNPGSDRFSLALDPSQVTTVSVFDAVGRIIIHERTMSGSNLIDASTWQAGVFHVKLRSADGLSRGLRWMKQ